MWVLHTKMAISRICRISQKRRLEEIHPWLESTHSYIACKMIFMDTVYPWLHCVYNGIHGYGMMGGLHETHNGRYVHYPVLLT